MFERWTEYCRDLNNYVEIWNIEIKGRTLNKIVSKCLFFVNCVFIFFKLSNTSIQTMLLALMVDLVSTRAGYQDSNCSVYLSVCGFCPRPNARRQRSHNRIRLPDTNYMKSSRCGATYVSCVCLSRSICGGKICFFNICTNLFYVNMYNIPLKQNIAQCTKIQNTCPIFT